MTVTFSCAVWKPAIHACCAASCDDAPAPTSSPERVEAAAEESGVADSFAAHEESARAARPPIATALRTGEIFTEEVSISIACGERRNCLG